MSGIDITSLANMLNPELSSESEDEGGVSTKYTPGDIGKPAKSKIPDITPTTVKKVSNGKDIWDDDLVPEGAPPIDHEETRPQPHFDMCFKQNVGTEDIFLGMSGKNPSTNDELVVTIDLPKTKGSEIDLDVQDNKINCYTPRHALRLHLPKPVQSKQGTAQWITDKEQLRLTLPLQKEFDFLP